MPELKSPHLTNIQMWQAWKEHGDIEAKKNLIENYLPLVDFVTNRMAIGLPKNVIKDDLASNGVMGLIDAIEKFDYKRGLQFETYASWRIRGSIIDGLRHGDWVPRSVREKAKRVEDAYQVLEQKYMRSVSDAEVSRYLQITEKEFTSMLQDISVASICSLEDPIRDEESETRMTLLVVSSPVRKSGTLSACFTTDTFGRVRGAAGSRRSRITTNTSYSPGSTENPRLIRTAGPGGKSTGKIASTG